MTFFDWCFPELLYWEVSEYSGKIKMIFVTSYKEFSIAISYDSWINRDEKAMHLKKIKLVHRILSGSD